MSNPTILNNSLWYAMAQTEDSLYASEYGTLWETKELDWTAYPRNTDDFKSWTNKEDKKMLEWFSQGFYIVKKEKDTLNYYSVKFGRANFKAKGTIEEDFEFNRYWFYKKDDTWIMKMTDPGGGDFDLKGMFLELVEKIRHK